MKNKLFKFLLIFLFSISILLRFWKMEYIPYQGDADELAYLFAGSSLIEKGYPISWTSLSDAYTEDQVWGVVTLGDEVYGDEDTYTFVTPWFDHPPLLPLIEGLWMKIWGYDFPQNASSFVIRLPMLALSFITLLLVFKISSFYFGKWGGLISLGLMGLSPSFIFAQRMVVGENLYVPLVLGAWYLAVKNKHWALIVGLCVLAGLSKITGLIGVPLLAYYYLTNKQWQKAAIFVAASLGIFLAIYIPYGWLIDWDQFLNMNVRQSFRLLGWGNPAFIFSHPGFHMRSLLDASYYLILFAGMLPVMLFTKGGKIPQVLIAAIFAGIALIWVTSTEQDMLGWYKIFLFSVLSIAAGSLALFKAQIPWLLLWGVAIVNNLNLVRYAQSPYPDHQLVRLAISGLIGVMLLLLLLENKLQKKIIPVLIGILLIANIAVSAYVTDKYFEAFCFDIHCPIPRVTLKSFLGL